MIQEPLQQEILSRIDKLTEQLGVMWPELVAHTVMEALIGIIVVVALVIFSGFSWYKSYGCDDGWEIAAVLCSMFAILGIIFVAVYCIPTLLMPEAATLKYILP